LVPLVAFVGRLSMALVSLMATSCAAVEERTIVYDTRYGESTSMDVFTPGGTALRPTVVIVHGGGWRLFHKERYRGVARRLARSGYVAVSVEYRLVPDGQFPNAAHDVACALAYVQNHASELGADPNRIVMLGYSAGAHLASLIATGNEDPGLAPSCSEGTPYKPAGVVSGAGPQDMFSLAQVGVVSDFLGGTPTTKANAYALASPITHVSADDPPFLFIHGSRDLLVPIEQALEMRDELEAVGVETSFLTLRGSGHIVNPSDDDASLDVATIIDSPEAWIAIMDFLDRTIGTP
jgi:acetyl esterase/lipase